jgi:peptide subunit release factor RF-3
VRRAADADHRDVIAVVDVCRGQFFFQVDLDE